MNANRRLVSVLGAFADDPRIPVPDEATFAGYIAHDISINRPREINVDTKLPVRLGSLVSGFNYMTISDTALHGPYMGTRNPRQLMALGKKTLFLISAGALMEVNDAATMHRAYISAR